MIHKHKVYHLLRPLWIPYAVAAAVALLMVAGGLFILRQALGPDLSNSEIFAQNFEAYPSRYTFRGDSYRDSVLSAAFAAYEAAEYGEAIVGFESSLADSASDMRVRFFLGLSYLSQGKGKKALLELKAVREGASSPFLDPTEWYNGLAYLQQEKPAKAKAVFESLAVGEGKYPDKAAKMLQDNF